MGKYWMQSEKSCSFKQYTDTDTLTNLMNYMFNYLGGGFCQGIFCFEGSPYKRILR